MGIVNCPLLVADEPGAWETVGGQLMSDAIETALGKAGLQDEGDLHWDAGPFQRWLVA